MSCKACQNIIPQKQSSVKCHKEKNESILKIGHLCYSLFIFTASMSIHAGLKPLLTAMA